MRALPFSINKKTPHVTCNAAPDPPSAQPTTPSLPPFPDRRFSSHPPSVPPLARCDHFVNLTNGLEALPALRAAGIDPGFVRLQSTLCEQGHMELIAQSLESDLLLKLALGRCCLMYDFGSRNKKRGAPRALWYGVEFVKYALAAVWGTKGTKRAFLRGHDTRAAFDSHIRKFSTSTKRRLNYYAQFLPPEGLEEIPLYGVYNSTERDMDAEFYRNIAHEHFLPGGEGAVRAAADPEVESLLNGDPHVAVQRLFGMHLFLGGLSHAEFAKAQIEIKD